jgi:hypothetical protein
MGTKAAEKARDTMKNDITQDDIIPEETPEKTTPEETVTETTDNNVGGPSIPGFDPDLLSGLTFDMTDIKVVTGKEATTKAPKGRKAAPKIVQPWWLNSLNYLLTAMAKGEDAAVIFTGTAGDFRREFTTPDGSRTLWLKSLPGDMGTKIRVTSDHEEVEGSEKFTPLTPSHVVVSRKLRVLPAKAK